MDAQHAAVRVARPVHGLWRLLILAWALSGIGLIALVVVGWELTSNRWNLIGLLCVLVGLGWAAWALVRSDPEEPDVFALDSGDAAELRRCCDELAERLDVPRVDALALTASPHVWCTSTNDRVVLMVGAPLLWHLSVDELRSVLAPVIAASALDRRPRVEQARRRASQFLTVYGSAPFALVWFVRRAAEAFDSRLNQMSREIHEWGERRALTSGVGPMSGEAAVVTEAWDMLLERFVAPAYHRAAPPAALGEGLQAMLDALDRHGLIEREWQRPEPQAPCSTVLLGAAEKIDRLFSEWIWAHNGKAGTFISWEDYPGGVVAAEARRRSNVLVSAVSTVVGTAVPATVDQILDVVDDAGLTVATVLAADPGFGRFGQRGNDLQLLALLEDHVEAFVATALVDAGIAARTLDWLDLVPLVDRDGVDLPVGEQVSAAVQSHSSKALRRWLASLGLQLAEPVFIGGVDPSASGRYARPILAPVYAPGLASLGQYDGSMLLLSGGTERLGRKVLDGLAFRPWVAEELSTHFTTPVERLVEQGKVKKSIPLADIVRVRLIDRRTAFANWRCVIETTNQRVVIRGQKPAAPAAAALTTVVGDRLSVRGVRLDPRTGCWEARDINPFWITLAKLTLCLAALPMLAAAGVAALTVATPPWPATVLDCVSVPDGSGADTDTTCKALVDGRSGHEVVTLKPAEPLPRGELVKVHFAEWIALDAFEEQDAWRFVRGLSILAAVVAVPAVLLATPWRRRKLRY